MKRGYIYIVIITLLLLSSFFIKSDNNNFKVDGIKYAVSVDDVAVSEFPEKAPYDVTIECQNADSYWNYDEWVAEIYNITDNVSCNINFTSREKVNIDDHITSLKGTVQGTGEVVEETYQVVTDSTFTPGSTLEQSDYIITSNTFTWDSTDKLWYNSNNPNSGLSMSFSPPENGDYQICYTLYSYEGAVLTISLNGSILVDTYEYGSETSCVNLKNLTTSSEIVVNYDTNSFITQDYVRFYLQNGTLTESTESGPAGIRYEGKNPNNYIRFNNEMWRIIGVFDTEVVDDDGNVIGTEPLTKIIRNDSIGGYAWNKNYENIWPNSSLYNLLNTYYYNADNGQSSGHCYQYSTSITGHCDYTYTGIQDYYRPMVSKVKWYLGGYSSTIATASLFYVFERSTSDDYYYPSNVNYKTANGHIGLMYVSDYGYSVLSSSCARTTNLGSYSSSSCAGNSWLKKETYEWTITYNSSYFTDVFTLNSSGELTSYYANLSYSTRPVLYLNSSVYIISGDGTEANPYYIAMD